MKKLLFSLLLGLAFVGSLNNTIAFTPPWPPCLPCPPAVADSQAPVLPMGQ